MSGNRYGSSVVNDVDRKLDAPAEKTDTMRKIVHFEGRPCVTLIAATSTQRGDTIDEHDDHVTLELSQRNPTTAPGNKAPSHRTSGTRYFRCKNQERIQ